MTAVSEIFSKNLAQSTWSSEYSEQYSNAKQYLFVKFDFDFRKITIVVINLVRTNITPFTNEKQLQLKNLALKAPKDLAKYKSGEFH